MNEFKIRELREARGMSQRQLANEVGVSPGAVAQWEAGTVSIRIERLLELADLFGCSLDYLCGREPPERTAS